MSIPKRVTRALESLLLKECTLYEQYIGLLEEERKFITHFNAEKVSELTLKRASVYEQMLKAQDSRLELMRNFPDHQGRKLRELIKSSCAPEDRSRLLPLAEHLRTLVIETQRHSREQGQILNFGLRVVHGLVSIFWSATQNVVRSYSRKGTNKESYNPQSRNSNVLKRA